MGRNINCFILLIALVEVAFCMPYNDQYRQLLLTNQIANEKNLRRQLEEPVDDSSHHIFEETNVPKVVEKIRSVELFKAKISSRLALSSTIAQVPGMKTRLMSIALEKFKSCESSRGSNERQDIGESCLGYATAQMMSLINAYENNPAKT